MATVLNANIEQREIFEGGYTPQGWGTIEFEQQAIRRYFIDLALGHRVVAVAVVDYVNAAKNQPADALASEEKVPADLPISPQ